MTITIRHAELYDAQALKAIHEDASVYANTLHLPMPTVQSWQKYFEDIPSHIHSFVAIIEDEIVGYLVLTVSPIERRRHAATFTVTVKTSAQGQGVGQALIEAAIDLADNWLNLRRIEITVFVDNKGAIRLYKKMGFVIEGELVDFAFRNGVYINSYQMARVRQN